MTNQPHSATAPPPRLPDDEISLWEVLATLIRGRRVIVLTAIVVAAIAVATGFIGGNKYTTEAAFRPEGSPAAGSDILALANQFGVDVGGRGTETGSPAFYSELLKSREILMSAAIASYQVEGVGQTTLAQLLEIEEATPELEYREVVKWLDERAVSVSVAQQTGTVTLSVISNWPDLSKKIADKLLGEVIRFNMNTRQSQAASERRFVQARVDSASAELLAAESVLQVFLEANRQWERSPLLTFQHDRLQRDVSLKSSVLTTLIQAFEQARIAERRDTPVITVIQEPFLPPGRDPRGTVMRAAVGIVIGGVIGVLLAFLWDAFRTPASGDPRREDFAETWDAFLRSIPLFGRLRA